MQCSADKSREKGAGNAEKNRDDEAARISARHQKLRDGTDDESDYQCPYYAHKQASVRRHYRRVKPELRTCHAWTINDREEKTYRTFSKHGRPLERVGVHIRELDRVGELGRISRACCPNHCPRK